MPAPYGPLPGISTPSASAYQRWTSSGSPTAKHRSPGPRERATIPTASRSCWRGPIATSDPHHAAHASAAAAQPAAARRAPRAHAPAASSTATPGTVNARKRAYIQLPSTVGKRSATAAPPSETASAVRSRASPRAAAAPARASGAAASDAHQVQLPPRESSIHRPSGPSSRGSLPSSARKSSRSPATCDAIGAYRTAASAAAAATAPRPASARPRPGPSPARAAAAARHASHAACPAGRHANTRCDHVPSAVAAAYAAQPNRAPRIARSRQAEESAAKSVTSA